MIIMKKRLLSVLVLPLMLTACAGNSVMNSAPHKVTANEISNGNWELVQIDHKLFHIFNGVISNPIFDFIMPFITNQNNWLIPFLILIYCLLFRGEKRGRSTFAILIITTILIDAVAAQFIKPMIGRIRPSHAIPEMINLLVPTGGKFSFVSNHAANAFGLSVILGYFYPAWKWKVTTLAFIIAFSRVYVGVH